MDLWIGCTAGFVTRDPLDTDSFNVDGPVVVAVIDEGRRVLVVSNAVFTVDLLDGELVEWLDGGDASSDVWYSALHTNQRIMCLLEASWISADVVDAEARTVMDPYQLLYVEHDVRLSASKEAMMHILMAASGEPSVDITLHNILGMKPKAGDKGAGESLEAVKARLPTIHPLQITEIWTRRHG